MSRTHVRHHPASLAGLLVVVLAVLVAGILAAQRAQAAHGVAGAAASAERAPAASTAPLAPTSRPVPQAPARRTATPPAAAPRPADPWVRFGFDISWPQCGPHGPVLPPLVGSTAIVGITNGRPFSTNACLAEEWRWASSRAHRGAYLNLEFPATGTDPTAYGSASVRDALARASKAGLDLRGVWLDVEVSNHWSADPAANVGVIRGAVTALSAAGLQPGIYSTPLDWAQITGGASLSLPVWQALPDGRKIAQGCNSAGFGGRQPDLVQAVFSAAGHDVDGDLICTTAPALAQILH